MAPTHNPPPDIQRGITLETFVLEGMRSEAAATGAFTSLLNEGKLLYEANPLAFLFEAAGGARSDGERRLLDIVPTSVHQRTPA